MKLILLLLSFSFLCRAQIDEGIPTRGLIGYWSFSGNARDQTRGGHDGTVHDAKIMSDRFGTTRSAYEFNGTSAFISTTYKGILGNHARAVSFWAKTSESLKAMPAITWGGGALYPSSGERFDCSFNYRLQNGVTMDISDAAMSYEAHRPIADGLWHHYVFQFNIPMLNKVEIYQDGDLLTHVGHRFYENTAIHTGQAFNVIFGAIKVPGDRNYFFKGQLDDIAIYDRALSLGEILDLYYAKNSDKTSLIIKWVICFFTVLLLLFLIIWLIRRRLRHLVLREKEKIEMSNRWYEQENRVLKAQMDPHFIFNSLNTILQFIVAGENEKAEYYLTKFSRLIRDLLESNVHESISLKEEIQILGKYLEIEALRFDNAFNYDIFVSQELDPEKVHIPNFLIQPFIENALRHGLLPKFGFKQLSISFNRQDKNTLVCTVDDNGVGRKKAAEYKSNSYTKSLSINFIRRRLQVLSKMHNGNYGVDIHDKVNEHMEIAGTTVKIQIPILKD